MKKISILFTSTLLCAVMFSCKSKQKIGGTNAPVVGEVEILIPCSNFKSDDKFFRATQSAISQDMAMARDKAMLNVKTRLAGLIESKIKNVMVSYRNEVTAGGAQEYSDKAEGEARDITNQTMNDVNVVCEKVTKSPDGRFNCYVSIEMAKDALAKKAANRVSQDDKLKIAYDQKKFREIFDKEMGQLKNEIPD